MLNTVCHVQVYDDPEDEMSWERYCLRRAALVVSCMADDRDGSAADLCDFMKGKKI